MKIYKQVNACHKAREGRRLSEGPAVIDKADDATAEGRLASRSQSEAVHFLPADALLSLQRQSVDDAQNSAFAIAAHLENGSGGSLPASNPCFSQRAGFPSNVEQPDGPFDGLNIEELWTWMLVTDATADPKSDIEWLHGVHGAP